MKVSFWLIWEAEVYDSFDIINIQPSCYEVRSNQIVNFTLLERLNRLQSLLLRHISVNFSHVESKHYHKCCKSSTLNFLVDKYYNPLFETSSQNCEQSCLSFQ